MDRFASLKKLLIGACAVVGLGMFGTSAGYAAACTPGPGVQCFTFTQNGSGGPSVPVGSVEVDTSGNVLTFKVDLSPDFSITTGNHHAFGFAIGTAPGTLNGTGTFGAITQTGAGSGNVLTPVNTTSAGVIDGNPPFGNFNFFLNCSANGGSTPGCGSAFTFTFTITSGSLIPSTGNSAVWFSADATQAGTTGVIGATTSVTAVPAPIIGAGLPGLLAACGGLLALARRRRHRNA